MTRFVQIAAVLTVLLLGALMLAVSPVRAQSAEAATSDAGDDASMRPALSVTVAPVASHDMSRKVTATGSVAAWREMAIGAEASGLAVTAVDVDEGDKVVKGQRLAKLNDAVLVAQIAQQKAMIEQAEATLAEARSDVDRASKMTKGVLSQQTIEQRATTAKTAAATLAASKALLQQYQAQLDRTEIKAPADGIVASRSATLGQVVQSGTELFRIIRDSRLEVDAKLAEADLLAIRPGQPVKVFGPGGGIYQASVRQAAEIVDAASRLGTVHVALPGGTPLKIGMFARVEIETGVKSTIAVPPKALVWRDGKAGIFTVSDGDVVTFSPVTLGRTAGDLVEITGGLDLGQSIVVAGAGLLNDGDKVRAEIASADALGAAR